MKLPNLRWTLAVLIAVALGFSQHLRADSITNNFNSGLDYLAHGVAGTMWDGLYYSDNDIFGGNNGGLVSLTLQANETATPGLLTVQDSNNGFSGTEDNGFYLWKVVAGDFDASVENYPPFATNNYHFGGIMARAYAQSPHWGSPFNGSENWNNICRFQEFGIDVDIREATNGTDNDNIFPTTGDNNDFNTTRFVRITRAGDVFSFYSKTNVGDPWTLHGTRTRTDMHGAAVQIGIADSVFTSAQPTTFYTDFELTGTNVVATPVPAADPTGLTAVENVASVTFSWTPGAGSTGSILLLRKNNPVILNEKPVNGYTYNGNTNFGSGDDIGGGIYAVYVGTNNTATVTGLGSTNQSYSVAVYSYTNNGTITVYGTGPATNSAIGTGIPQGITFTVTPTNGIPVNGAALSFLLDFDNIGNTNVVPNGSASWSSDNSAVAIANPADGTITGVSPGSAHITASFNGFNASNSITVHAPAFTDNFGTAHDYLNNALPGSTWDGLYVNGLNIPNATFGPPPATVAAINANISSNNALFMSAANSAWKNNQDNGPFLFKNVPGDFQVVIHITNYDIVNYQFAGLMARAYSAANNASGSGPGNSENSMQWMRFDEFGFSTGKFNTLNGGTAESEETDGDTTDYWLLMVRNSATNFYFFKKANLTDPWLAVTEQFDVRPDWTNGVPLQVGPRQSSFSGATLSVAYDNFMLDAANITGTNVPTAPSGLTMTMSPSLTSMTLTWVPGTNADNTPVTSFVVMRAGAPVSAQPYFGILTSASSVFGAGTDLGGGNYLVCRAVTNSVTVTGLKPGTVYYATVYGYWGSGGTKTFNESGSITTNSPPVVFTNFTATLPTGKVPVGGVGFLTAIGDIQPNGTLDISREVQFADGNPSIAVGTNGFVTGLAPGLVTNTLYLVNGTNTLTNHIVITVRSATFTDNFSTSHDYIANGVTGTGWDGVLASGAAPPNSTYVPNVAAVITDADANTTSNGVLNVTSTDVGWEGAQDNGFFLWKNVSGDFQASVHLTYLCTNGAASLGIANSNIGPFNTAGLMARLSTGGGATFTNGLGTNAEYWVSFTRFDEFNEGTYARREQNNGVTQSPSVGSGFPGPSDTNYWLLMVRQNLTNMTFFQRQNATDPWNLKPDGITYSPTNFIYDTLEVGINGGGFNPSPADIVQDGFDTFTLDITPTPSLSAVNAGGGTVNVDWVPSGNFALEYSPSLAHPNWQPVGITPVFTNGTQVGTPVGPGPVFSGGMNTVTVPSNTNSATFFRLQEQ